VDEAKPFDIPKQEVWEAFKKVKANQGAAGVDGQSVAEFEAELSDNLYKLWNRMSSGSYFPPPVRRVMIPKSGGSGERPLGIPTVADRVAQEVVKRYLEPILEPIFHDDSYGYRPGRSAIDAVRTARQRCWRYDWVLDIDVKGYFDSIDWGLLLKAVRKHTDCPWVLLYIERWLKAPLQKQDGTLIERTKGVPQGSIIAPRTHPQTLCFPGDLRSKGEDFDYFIKSSIFMINGKSTEFRTGQADQPGVYPFVEGEARCGDSGSFNREIRNFFNTSLSLCTAGQGEQWESGCSGSFCGIYGETAAKSDQAGKEVCPFPGNVDKQSGLVSAGRVSVKAGSWQKRRDKLKCRFATTGCGSKSSPRFIISLFHHRILVLSALANPLLN